MLTRLSQRRCDLTLTTIRKRFDLKKVTAEGGGAHLPQFGLAPRVQAPIRQVRVFKRGPGMRWNPQTQRLSQYRIHTFIPLRTARG